MICTASLSTRRWYGRQFRSLGHVIPPTHIINMTIYLKVSLPWILTPEQSPFTATWTKANYQVEPKQSHSCSHLKQYKCNSLQIVRLYPAHAQWWFSVSHPHFVHGVLFHTGWVNHCASRSMTRECSGRTQPGTWKPCHEDISKQRFLEELPSS